MLPTTGFFKDIECPFFEDSCGRPYCHFRHKKKVPDQSDSPKTASSEETEVPTYNPTPKSQLANPRTQNHIPIRYVPDLADLSKRSRKVQNDELPTYNPTPLCMLSGFNKAGNSSTTDDSENKNPSYSKLSLNYPNVEYNPNEPLTADSINFEELSTEFDMIDDIINDCDDEKEENGTVQTAEPPTLTYIPTKKVEKASESHTTDKKSGDHKRSDKGHRSTEKSSTKEPEKSSKESRTARHSHKDKHKSKSSSHKEKHKDKHKSRHNEKKHHEKSSNKSKEKDKTTHKTTEKHKEAKEKESKSRSKQETPKEKLTKDKQSESDSDTPDNIFDNAEVEFDSDDETLEECYRIFTEYKPEQPKLDLQSKIEDKKTVEETISEESSSKKRVAHEKAENLARKVTRPPPKPTINPALAMTNRFKMARLAQASNEQSNLINAVKQQAMKRPATSATVSSSTSCKQQKMITASVNKLSDNKINNRSVSHSASLIDDIIAGNSKPKRIAPVQNVNSMQRAKAKIEELARQKAANAKKTLAQSVSKGSARVAHCPEFTLCDIPDVLEAEKSKLPVNVRTRYLTMIADECVKLYLTKEDAYQRALNEEFKCYERCKVLTTYRNSAMLSVNRLRKEIQERAKEGLDPMSSLDDCKANEVSELRGKKFYENIKQYVLTEDELLKHGYPRESAVPGRALFPNLKATVSMSLGENERLCSRCSKIYVVDDEGFALYEQECIYHPLKKRTFRGESTYLCCKSSDDTGCVTSTTHVSEQSVESEMEGFQTTMEPESDSDARSYAVYALDCEMCYTTKGLELTRVTIVDVDCKTVYESLVKPLNTIIDYNTRFSGITKDQMDRTSTSILQVQANILHLCNSETILIGHSLESDMKALKIVHSNIVDTSVLFPHKLGLPHKRALRNLASEYLKKIIQNDINGHDSAEDALACMELVIWKVKEDLKVRGIKV